VVGSKNARVEQLAKQVEDLQERLQEEVARREELEASLRASDETLHAAGQTADETACLKSSLLTTMSHELRTPLTSMIAHASILESKLDGSDRDSARAIQRNGKRLTQTLDSVFILTELEGKAFKPVPREIHVAELLADSLETLRPRTHDKGLWLRTSLDDDLVIHSDPRCLRRILGNLIGNAIKFTDDGGVSVCIHTEDEFVLEVSDTGVGMSEAFLVDLFEAFTQESSGLTRTHEGSGLGLAITWHLVRALDGTIEVDSQKGVGTAFTVRLPWKHLAERGGAPVDPSTTPTALIR
jgi:signal transduction histidine kinase